MDDCWRWADDDIDDADSDKYGRSDDEDDFDRYGRSDDEDDFDRYGRSDYDIRLYTLKSTKWRQFVFPQELIIEYLTSNVTLMKWMIAEGELMMI